MRFSREVEGVPGDSVARHLKLIAADVPANDVWKDQLTRVAIDKTKLYEPGENSFTYELFVSGYTMIYPQAAWFDMDTIREHLISRDEKFTEVPDAVERFRPKNGANVPAVAQFKVFPWSPTRVMIKGECHDYADAFMGRILERIDSELPVLHRKAKKPTRGPTVNTQERARVFKKLKDQHPEWGYETVAYNATEELGESVTGETVRNCFRAMGFKWERADRIR